MRFTIYLLCILFVLSACSSDSSSPDITVIEQESNVTINETDEGVDEEELNASSTEIFESDRPSPSHLAHCQGLSPAQSGECIRAAYSDSDVCDALDEPYRDDCFTQVAKDLGDVDVCEYILDDMRKSNCYFGVAIHLALSEEDLEYCELTRSVSDRDECLWGYYIITKDETVCSLLSDELLQEMCMS